MNKTETKKILDIISAIDNRKLDEGVALAWHAVLNHIPLDIAKQAHILARRDERVNYLEPRHIVSWAKEAAFKLDRQKAQPEQEPTHRDEEPVCKAHNKTLLTCKHCCHKLQEMSHLSNADLLAWAKAHVYLERAQK
jgi:hypothetical protein